MRTIRPWPWRPHHRQRPLHHPHRTPEVGLELVLGVGDASVCSTAPASPHPAQATTASSRCRPGRARSRSRPHRLVVVHVHDHRRPYRPSEVPRRLAPKTFQPPRLRAGRRRPGRSRPTPRSPGSPVGDAMARLLVRRWAPRTCRYPGAIRRPGAKRAGRPGTGREPGARPTTRPPSSGHRRIGPDGGPHGRRPAPRRWPGPEAGALATTEAPIGAVVAIEDHRQLVGTDARSVVDHPDDRDGAAPRDGPRRRTSGGGGPTVRGRPGHGWSPRPRSGARRRTRRSRPDWPSPVPAGR